MAEGAFVSAVGGKNVGDIEIKDNVINQTMIHHHNYIQGHFGKPRKIREGNEKHISDNPEEEDRHHLTDNIWFSQEKPICQNSDVYLGGQSNEIVSRQLAVKFLKYSEKSRTEAKILMKLRFHPNIVTIIHAGVYKIGSKIDRKIFIAMELCDCNLAEFIKCRNKERIPFDSKLMKSFGNQIVRALQFIHKYDVVHRDLKPSNILLSLDRTWVKICDFGLSKELEEGKSVMQQTSSGIGTQGYRSPENLKSKEFSKYSDIFSLGLVLYFTWSNGEHAFGSNRHLWDNNIIQNINRDLSKILIERARVAKGLIASILHPDPRKRLTAEQVLDHGLFVLTSVSEPGTPKTTRDKENVASFRVTAQGSRKFRPFRLPDKHKDSGNMTAVGIDIGLTNSCVAVHEHERVMNFQNYANEDEEIRETIRVKNELEELVLRLISERNDEENSDLRQILELLDKNPKLLREEVEKEISKLQDSSDGNGEIFQD